MIREGGKVSLLKLCGAEFSADLGLGDIFPSSGGEDAMAWCRGEDGKGQEVGPMGPVGRPCWPAR